MTTASGVDIIDSFLQELETYNADNCKPGTATKLGPGVVQQYGKTRFRKEAELAVERANLLTEIWKLDNLQLQTDEQFFYAQVLNLVQSDADIFAAGNCYNKGEFKDYELFCPYAYRMNGSILVKDLSVEYPYLGYEWFRIVRETGQELISHRNLTKVFNKWRLQMDNGTSYHSQLNMDASLLMTYDDGHWSTPYFDCGGGNIWMMTYTVPFFQSINGSYRFKGSSGIDIALQKVDIDQCSLPADSTDTNVFANTSKCLLETTECRTVRGMGFRRGSYICICKPGFYFPNLQLAIEDRYFNGSYMEQQFDLYTQGKKNSYEDLHCLPCKEGCDVCEDDRSCILELNWPVRNLLLAAMCTAMSVIPLIAFLVWKHQEDVVLKAASPKLLGFILGGAFCLYCPMIVMYFRASVLTCCLKVWLRELGFTISYGALLLKTWRISAVFKVTTASQIKIRDTDLIKRLAILVAITALFLIIRMVWGRPSVEEGKTKDDLKVYQCSFNEWDYGQAAAELFLLVWGIKLSIEVRKAPSQFNESQFISWAIYNETLLAIFLNLTLFLLQYIDFSSPDVLYLINFIYISLTTTVMLVFLFSTKAYLMYKTKKHPAGSRGSVSRRSGVSQFKLAPKSGGEFTALDGDLDNSNTVVDKELKRVYEELSQLKQQLLKENNPHLMQNGGSKTHAQHNCPSPTSGSNNPECDSPLVDTLTEKTLLMPNNIIPENKGFCAFPDKQKQVRITVAPTNHQVKIEDLNNVTAV
ncbi:metabotropic glycine receptor-like [Watersipora subatra]|uniref:metabotropic glycine receptor-like n=1 Tax=Watersipora subatra TaxID=2589382 RepID=UPI00355B0553